MAPETNTVREIVNEDGYAVEVRPWPEAPDVVAIMSRGEANRDWFGPLGLTMSPEFARHIGEALIACANELSDEQK